MYQQSRRIETASQQSSTISEHLPPLQTSPVPESLADELAQIRLPKAVQATYLKPLVREAQHGIVSADLQLRSYSVRNLEVFTDFAMRAAYYLNLPTSGPKPLRRIVERYTVPRSNFVHKKSQENFERVTKRRWIRILDGSPENVRTWMTFLHKYRYYGVGMKCDFWHRGPLTESDEATAPKSSPLKSASRGRKLLASPKPFGTKFKAYWAGKGAMGPFHAFQAGTAHQLQERYIRIKNRRVRAANRRNDELLKKQADERRAKYAAGLEAQSLPPVEVSPEASSTEQASSQASSTQETSSTDAASPGPEKSS